MSNPEEVSVQPVDDLSKDGWTEDGKDNNHEIKNLEYDVMYTFRKGDGLYEKDSKYRWRLTGRVVFDQDKMVNHYICLKIEHEKEYKMVKIHDKMGASKDTSTQPIQNNTYTKDHLLTTFGALANALNGYKMYDV